MIVFLTLAARLLLAAVFAIAGVAKLRDRAGTRTALEEFGAPSRTVRPLALVLPAGELMVVVLLVPAPTSAVGAAGALFLVAIFSVAIAWSLARGRSPECHCFGQLHSAPAGRRTLARNGALGAIALVALAGSVAEEPASGAAWLGGLEGAELVALALAVAATLLAAAGATTFLSLMRSYGTVLVRLERIEQALLEAGIAVGGDETMPEVGLAPGTPAPAFFAASPAGDVVSIESLTSSGVPALLVFTSPRCEPCTALLPTLAAWQDAHAEELTVVVASDGSLEEVRSEAEAHGLRNVVLDEDRRVYEAYRANGTPSAVVLSPGGTIASWVASGAEWIEHLVDATLGRRDDGGLPVGAHAPDLELPSLAGEAVSLPSLRGRATLLVFWNPSCGFCRSMHDDLLAWERSANGVTPRLVVVSSGDPESTRAEGFRSTVLLDPDYAASAAFGADGTPMAVLVDAEGRVAAPVVAGPDDVLALARRPVERVAVV